MVQSWTTHQFPKRREVPGWRARYKLRFCQDQDQRSEPEAKSQVRSKSDDVLHAVSIPAYETHRWKEDSSSPNLDGDLAQGANKIYPLGRGLALPVFSFAKSARGPFRVTVPAFALQPGKTTEYPDWNSTKGTLILIAIWLLDFWVVSPEVGIVSAEGLHD